MRRVLLLIVFIAFSLSACIGSIDNSKIELVDTDSTYPIVIMDDQYGTILFSKGRYNYFVYGKNKEVIEKGESVTLPEIILLDDNILKFSLQTGTGKSTQWGFYYDIERGVKSNIFTCVYDESGGKVVYGLKNKIVVRDIFDNSPSGYCCEFSSFSPPLSDMIEPILDATFVSGGNEIEVIYFSGEDFNEKTQRFMIQ